MWKSSLSETVTNPRVSAKLQAMVREISAGGVVIQRRNAAWWMAAIEPPGDADRVATDQTNVILRKPKAVLALPKGLVDPGEKPMETALREVYEETGVTADLITQHSDHMYVYTRP